MTTIAPETPQTVVQERQKSLNYIGPMRLVLAMLVIISHSFALTDSDNHREWLYRLTRGDLDFGSLAVDGFFIISGFLLAQSWIRTPKATIYLEKRVLRIYPGFIVACLISVFIVGALGSVDKHVYFHQISLPRFIARMLQLRPPASPPVVFPGYPFPIVNGSLWTIQYEAWCYLLLMGIGAIGLLKKPFACIGLFLLVFGLYIVQTYHGLPSIGEHFLLPASDNFPRLITFFLAGTCFSLYRKQLEWDVRYALVALTVAIVGCLVHASCLVLPVAGTYVLLSFGQKTRKTVPSEQYENDYSYGVYLYAFPVQKLLVWYLAIQSPILLMISAAPLAYLCAIPSWHLIEKPCQGWKRKHLEVL